MKIFFFLFFLEITTKLGQKLQNPAMRWSDDLFFREHENFRTKSIKFETDWK